MSAITSTRRLAVLAELARRERTLSDLSQDDVDRWLAEGKVVRRAELPSSCVGPAVNG